MGKSNYFWVPLVVITYTLCLLQARRLLQSPSTTTPVQGSQQSPVTDPPASAVDRQQFIVDMAKHAWSGYMRAAAGHDEVQPLSGTSNDRWGRIGVTAIDSMDTLLLMGLEKEFHEARLLTKQIHIEKGTVLSPFETVIRHVGAAVAYAVTADEELLTLATSIANGLLPSYEGPYSLPRHRAPFHSVSYEGAYQSILAEAGSTQLEFRFLSALTGDDRYELTANALTRLIHEARAAGWPHNASWYRPTHTHMPTRSVSLFVSQEGHLVDYWCGPSFG